MIPLVLTILAAVAAIESAGLWIWASLVKVPPFTGDTWEGEGEFSKALRWQSNLNAYAAMCAAAAAVFQGLSLLAPLIGL